MFEYFVYYAQSNIVCAIIFGIMIIHDMRSVDRQEKQIKFDHALIAFALYFLSDAIWAGVDSGVFPVTKFTAITTNFSNYVLMAAITYMWLRYVMAVEKTPNRERREFKFALLLPFIVSTVAYIATFFIAPNVLLDVDLKPQPASSVFLVAVPLLYIMAVVIYTARKALHEPNPTERKQHIYVGFFPLIIIVLGMFETVIAPTLPLYCYSSTILMLVFYIQAMEARISIDPLTGLNNRGQLAHYVSQNSNIYQDDRLTSVIMMDIDDFKSINDAHGHAEGDRALVIVANALKESAKHCSHPTFLGRYGGDEFVVIVHPLSEADIDPLLNDIRARIETGCKDQQTPYLIGISAGYDTLADGDDTYQNCMERADQKLYNNKMQRKS